MLNHTFNSNLLPVTNGVLNVHEQNLFTMAVNDIHQVSGSPVELAQSAVLGSISTVQQGIITFNDHNNVQHSVSLYIMGTAASGVGKTRPVEMATSVIKEHESDFVKTHKSDMEDYKAELDVWTHEYNTLLKDKDLLPCDKRLELSRKRYLKPTPPKKIKINYGNSTNEALVDGMANHYPYVGILTAEGGSELSGGLFKMTAIANSVWSSEPITLSRKTTDSYDITDASLTIAITTQPDIFDKYTQKNGKEAAGSGFFARCLFFQTLGARLNHTIDETDAIFIKEYNERLSSLINEAVTRFNDGKPRKTLHFDKDSKLHFQNLEHEIRSEMHPNGRFSGTLDHGAKLLNNIQRIAANISYFCYGDEDISLNTSILATQIGAFYSDHYRAMFVKPPQYIQNAMLLNEWLNQFRSGQTFLRKNFLLTNGPKVLRKSEKLNEALDELMRAGVVRIFQDGRTTWVNINPSFFPDILPIELQEQSKKAIQHRQEANQHGY